VFHVSHRPLAIVSGLTIGDYLLWNWSLNGSHDVLALVSGLTLPPLAAASLWLIALTAARLLARVTGRAARRAPAQARPTRRMKARQSRAIARSRRELRRETSAVQASTPSPVQSVASSRQPSSSRKLAA
jgi:hypothetical protein